MWLVLQLNWDLGPKNIVKKVFIKLPQIKPDVLLLSVSCYTTLLVVLTYRSNYRLLTVVIFL